MALQIRTVRDETSITLWVTGLATEYVHEDRCISYYIKETAEPDSAYFSDMIAYGLGAGIAATEPYEFYDLDLDTSYDIKVIIKNLRGHFNDIVLTETVSTSWYEPILQKFKCYSYNTEIQDKLRAECLFSATNIVPGETTYRIFARQSGTTRWWERDPASISSSSANEKGTSVIGRFVIILDNYDDLLEKFYDFKLVVETEYGTDELIVSHIKIINNKIEEVIQKDIVDTAAPYYVEFCLKLRGPYANFMIVSCVTSDDDGNSIRELTYENLFTKEDFAEEFYPTFFGELPSGSYRTQFWLYEYESEEAYENGDSCIYECSRAYEYDVASSGSPKITSFTGEQTAEGEKYILCKIKLRNIYPEISTYVIEVRKRNGEWLTKIEDTVYESSFEVIVGTDGFGEHEVRLIVYNDTLSKTTSFLVNMLKGETETPEYWYWKQEYDLSSGEVGTIGTNAILYCKENREIPTINAKEWNDFGEVMLNLKAYMESQGYSVNGVRGSFTEVYPGDEITPEIYNEVAGALRALSSGYGIKYAIDDINDDTVLCASIFTNLQDQFNYIIDCMS